MVILRVIAFQVALVVKKPPADVGDPLFRKIP